MTKIFIVGLPRTGTTSICARFLDMGCRVAHTAYTQQSFDLAEVIADTPVFSEYKELDKLYPSSKFIYLQRSISHWTPSVQSLLERIRNKYQGNPHAFHPLLIHSFENIFGGLQKPDLLDKQYLKSCYEKHEQNLNEYFSNRKEDFISIEISHDDSFSRLVSFLNLGTDQLAYNDFPLLNKNGQISAWDKIKHPLKIGSNEIGKNGRRYFSYFGK